MLPGMLLKRNRLSKHPTCNSDYGCQPVARLLRQGWCCRLLMLLGVLMAESRCWAQEDGEMMTVINVPGASIQMVTLAHLGISKNPSSLRVPILQLPGRRYIITKLNADYPCEEPQEPQDKLNLTLVKAVTITAICSSASPGQNVNCTELIKTQESINILYCNASSDQNQQCTVAQCETCNANNNTTCSKCHPLDIFSGVPLYRHGSKCANHTECSIDSSYGDSETGICKKCPNNCTKCSEGTGKYCYECMGKFHLQNYMCMPNCSKGFIEHDGRCLRPNDCTLGTVARDGKCTKCKDRFCLYCDENLSCLTCAQPFFLSNGSCHSRCGDNVQYLPRLHGLALEAVVRGRLIAYDNSVTQSNPWPRACVSPGFNTTYAKRLCQYLGLGVPISYRLSTFTGAGRLVECSDSEDCTSTAPCNSSSMGLELNCSGPVNYRACGNDTINQQKRRQDNLAVQPSEYQRINVSIVIPAAWPSTQDLCIECKSNGVAGVTKLNITASGIEGYSSSHQISRHSAELTLLKRPDRSSDNSDLMLSCSFTGNDSVSATATLKVESYPNASVAFLKPTKQPFRLLESNLPSMLYTLRCSSIGGFNNTFQWYNETSKTISSTPFLNISSTQNGSTYFCRARNAFGLSFSEPVLIRTAEVAVSETPSQWLDYRQHVTLECGVQLMDYELNISWDCPGIRDPAEGRNIPFTSNTSCVCNASNVLAFGRRQFKYNVKPQVAPKAELVGDQNITVNSTSQVDFTCRAIGQPKPSITWRFSGPRPSFGNLSVCNESNECQEVGSTFIVNNNLTKYDVSMSMVYNITSTLVSMAVAANDSGTYACVASDNVDGVEDHVTYQLYVQYPPTVAVVRSEDSDLKAGDNAMFLCNITAYPYVSWIEWSHNNVTIAVQNTTDFDFSNCSEQTTNSTKYCIEMVGLEDELGPRDEFHKRNVSLLAIRLFQPMDVGEITCTAENILGIGSGSTKASIIEKESNILLIAIVSSVGGAIFLALIILIAVKASRRRSRQKVTVTSPGKDAMYAGSDPEQGVAGQQLGVQCGWAVSNASATEIYDDLDGAKASAMINRNGGVEESCLDANLMPDTDLYLDPVENDHQAENVPVTAPTNMIPPPPQSPPPLDNLAQSPVPSEVCEDIYEVTEDHTEEEIEEIDELQYEVLPQDFLDKIRSTPDTTPLAQAEDDKALKKPSFWGSVFSRKKKAGKAKNQPPITKQQESLEENVNEDDDGDLYEDLPEPQPDLRPEPQAVDDNASDIDTEELYQELPDAETADPAKEEAYDQEELYEDLTQKQTEVMSQASGSGSGTARTTRTSTPARTPARQSPPLERNSSPVQVKLQPIPLQPSAAADPSRTMPPPGHQAKRISYHQVLLQKPGQKHANAPSESKSARTEKEISTHKQPPAPYMQRNAMPPPVLTQAKYTGHRQNVSTPDREPSPTGDGDGYDSGEEYQIMDGGTMQAGETPFTRSQQPQRERTESETTELYMPMTVPENEGEQFLGGCQEQTDSAFDPSASYPGDELYLPMDMDGSGAAQLGTADEVSCDQDVYLPMDVNAPADDDELYLPMGNDETDPGSGSQDGELYMPMEVEMAVPPPTPHPATAAITPSTPRVPGASERPATVPPKPLSSVQRSASAAQQRPKTFPWPPSEGSASKPEPSRPAAVPKPPRGPTRAKKNLPATATQHSKLPTPDENQVPLPSRDGKDKVDKIGWRGAAQETKESPRSDRKAHTIGRVGSVPTPPQSSESSPSLDRKLPARTPSNRVPGSREDNLKSRPLPSSPLPHGNPGVPDAAATTAPPSPSTSGRGPNMLKQAQTLPPVPTSSQQQPSRLTGGQASRPLPPPGGKGSQIPSSRNRHEKLPAPPSK